MAQEDGCWVVEVFEEGQTAHERGRAEYERMIARLDEVEAVYVVAYDRLTRIPDPSEQEAIRRLFVATATDIITPGIIWRYSDPDFDTPETRLHQRVQGLFSAHEWETITRRLAKGKKKHIELGAYYGHPVPYGYEQSFHPETGAKVFTVKEDEAAIVRRIFDLYQQGQGLNGIARHLNDQGIPSPKGKRWSVAGLRNIIRQSLYGGFSEYRKPHRRQKKPGPTIRVPSRDYPALVDAATFERVQALIPERVVHHKHGPGEMHPLSGLLRCPSCDRTMGMVSARSKRQPTVYYACRGLKKEVACDSPALYRAEEAHRLVLDFLKKELRRYKDERHKVPKKQAVQASDLIPAANKRIAEIEKKFAGVVDLAALKVITAEEATKRLDELRAEMDKAKTHLVSLELQQTQQTGQTHLQAEFRMMAELIQNVREDHPQLRSVFERLLLRVYLKREGKDPKDRRRILLSVERVMMRNGKELTGENVLRFSN